MSKVKKKNVQLGVHYSTASNRLKKELLFSLIEKNDENWCFQCGAKIESSTELSIEHKTPWLDSENPKELFFDLSNIAYSHFLCNSGAARRHKGIRKHPSMSAYQKGCRCDECKELKAAENKRNRKK